LITPLPRLGGEDGQNKKNGEKERGLKDQPPRQTGEVYCKKIGTPENSTIGDQGDSTNLGDVWEKKGE